MLSARIAYCGSVEARVRSRIHVRCFAKISSSVPPFSAVKFPAPEPGGYGEISYWDKRYAEQPDATLDWFSDYSRFEPIVRKHIPKSSRVLMAGCGNSAMSNDMVEDGYQEIVNTDLSSVVIDNFKARYAHVPQLSCILGLDSRDMSAFQDCSFDAIIDKGLADAMLCGVDPAEGVLEMLRETYRILRPQGVFMLITYGHPEIRMPALLEPGLKWSILLYALAKPGTEKAVMETIEGVTPDSLPIDERNWSLGLEDFGGDKGMTFVYVCSKPNEADK
ncbi:hypothetical protein SELMODRAFT_427489 [Selaginella moellendorffii]|uniref:Methyltransferase type 11 domain-containing protein n=1 Tax=Selaginella moellendorffii TaxID=88036 RepID=D8SZS5_SELML|nr:hypothetical protein SELMODRAFT_427489 [Selaginella moellendorffii]